MPMGSADGSLLVLVAGKAASLMSKLSGARVEAARVVELLEEAKRAVRLAREQPVPRAYDVSVAEKVLEARTAPGSRESSDSLAYVVAWALVQLPAGEAMKAAMRSMELDAARSGTAPRAGARGLAGLLLATAKFMRSPRYERMLELLIAAGTEAAKPCMASSPLRDARERFERRMRAYGALLGVLFPLFFVLSLMVGATYVILLVAIMALVWGAIRRDGATYRWVSVEVAWDECRITPEELRGLGHRPKPPQAAVLSMLSRV